MGTIVTRKRSNGVKYTAQIRLSRGGKLFHSEAQTFDRKQDAKRWMVIREAELNSKDVVLNDPTLAEIIAKYLKEIPVPKVKEYGLKAIAKSDLAHKRGSTIKSADIVAYIQQLNIKPQTRANRLSYFSLVFSIAGPAWGYPLDKAQVTAAATVLRKFRQVGASPGRERRPTVAEMDRLMAYYATAERNDIPMMDIIMFAMFSTRRRSEITRIAIEEFDKDRVLVRDMKHPGKKAGNDQWCYLPPEAVSVIERVKPAAGSIFPYNGSSIGTNFTNACKVLGIVGLRFHDLRHEGVSRPFEMGWTIPQVAAVSGHRSWTSLKRYAHLRQTGDKWAGWKWLTERRPT